jgi:hypothetical protein
MSKQRRVPQAAPSFGTNLGEATARDEFFLKLSMLTQTP